MSAILVTHAITLRDCRIQQHAASSLQSSEDVIDCLPELIDYVDGHHERLQALVGSTLSSTQTDQVITF